MNQLLEPKTTESPRRRGRMPGFLRDEDTQSVVIGILLTLILWPLLVVSFSWAVGHLHGTSGKFAATPRPREFNIEIAQDAFKPRPKPPPPNRFVETNPNAPENIPDKTNNFGSHNQQAAQPKPSLKTGSDHPATEGHKDIDSTQIVDGQLNKKPLPSAAPEPLPQPANPGKAAPMREQNPLSGFEKNIGEAKDAIGTNAAKPAENMQDVPKKVEGQKDVPLIESADATPQIDPKHPRQRPTLAMRNVRPALFSENPIGTINQGESSWDARWSNYGQYLDQLIDTVQIQWDQLLHDSGGYPPSGTKVKITFRLKSDGTVSQIISMDGDAGKLGETYCASAITIPGSPPTGFGKWTDDMVALMGDYQDLTFTFYYY